MNTTMQVIRQLGDAITFTGSAMGPAISKIVCSSWMPSLLMPISMGILLIVLTLSMVTPRQNNAELHKVEQALEICIANHATTQDKVDKIEKVLKSRGPIIDEMQKRIEHLDGAKP